MNRKLLIRKPGVILDYDLENRVVGVEFLNVSSRATKDELILDSISLCLINNYYVSAFYSHRFSRSRQRRHRQIPRELSGLPKDQSHLSDKPNGQVRPALGDPT